MAAGGSSVGDYLERLFAYADPDRSNRLTKEEFVTVMNDSLLKLTEADVEKLYKKLDPKRTGAMKWREFLPLAANFICEVHKARLEEGGARDWVELPATDLVSTFWFSKRTADAQLHTPIGVSRGGLDGSPPLVDYLSATFHKLDDDSTGCIIDQFFSKALGKTLLRLKPAQLERLMAKVPTHEGKVEWLEFSLAAGRLLTNLMMTEPIGFVGDWCELPAHAGRTFWYDKRRGQSRWERPKLSAAEERELSAAPPTAKEYLAQLFKHQDPGMVGSLPADDFWELLQDSLLDLGEDEVDLLAKRVVSTGGHGGAAARIEWNEFTIESNYALVEAYVEVQLDGVPGTVEDLVPNEAEWVQLPEVVHGGGTRAGGKSGGLAYWFNKRTMESQWEKPAIVVAGGPSATDYLRQVFLRRDGGRPGEAVTGLLPADEVWETIGCSLLELSQEDAVALRDRAESNSMLTLDGAAAAAAGQQPGAGRDDEDSEGGSEEDGDGDDRDGAAAGKRGGGGGQLMQPWCPAILRVPALLAELHDERERDFYTDWCELPAGEGALTFWFNKRSGARQREQPHEEDEPPDPRSAEVKAIRLADHDAHEMQKQGKFLEALECMERSLLLRERFCGPGSPEVWDGCKVAGELCNVLARSYMEQGTMERVYELLRKAETLTARHDGGRAATFNNLGMFYRRQGKLHAALTYLQQAAEIEHELGHEAKHPADTALNLSAVLSELGRHSEALRQARMAVAMLQEELFSVRSAAGALHEKAARIAVYAVAWHNVGAEQEYLKKHALSLESYRKGMQIAERYLGAKHAITVRLRNSIVAARRNLKIHTKRHQEEGWQPLVLPDLGAIRRPDAPPPLSAYLRRELARRDEGETGRLGRAAFGLALHEMLLNLSRGQVRRLLARVYFAPAHGETEEETQWGEFTIAAPRLLRDIYAKQRPDMKRDWCELPAKEGATYWFNKRDSAAQWDLPEDFDKIRDKLTPSPPPPLAAYLEREMRRLDPKGTGCVDAEAFWPHLWRGMALKLAPRELAALHAGTGNNTEQGPKMGNGNDTPGGGLPGLVEADPDTLVPEHVRWSEFVAAAPTLLQQTYMASLYAEAAAKAKAEGEKVAGAREEAERHHAKDWVELPAEFGGAYWYNRRTGAAQWAMPEAVAAAEREAHEAGIAGVGGGTSGPLPPHVGVHLRALLGAADEDETGQLPSGEFWQLLESDTAGLALSEAQKRRLRARVRAHYSVPGLVEDAAAGIPDAVSWCEFCLAFPALLAAMVARLAPDYERDWCRLVLDGGARACWYDKRTCSRAWKRPTRAQWDHAVARGDHDAPPLAGALQRQLERLDADGSGVLLFDELFDALRAPALSATLGLTDAEVGKLQKHVETDGDGDVPLAGFVAEAATLISHMYKEKEKKRQKAAAEALALANGTGKKKKPKKGGEPEVDEAALAAAAAAPADGELGADWCELPAAQACRSHWYNKLTLESSWEPPPAVAALRAAADEAGDPPPIGDYFSRSFKKAADPPGAGECAAASLRGLLKGLSLGLESAEVAALASHAVPDADGEVEWTVLALGAPRLLSSLFEAGEPSYERDWCEVQTSDVRGRKYWYNKRTRRACWERPPQAAYEEELDALSGVAPSVAVYIGELCARADRSGAGELEAEAFFGEAVAAHPLLRLSEAVRRKMRRKVAADGAGRIAWHDFVEGAPQLLKELQETAKEKEKDTDGSGGLGWIELPNPKPSAKRPLTYWYCKATKESQWEVPPAVVQAAEQAAEKAAPAVGAAPTTLREPPAALPVPPLRQFLLRALGRLDAHGKGEAEARDAGQMLANPAFPLGLKRAEAAALRRAFAMPVPPTGADGSFALVVPPVRYVEVALGADAVLQRIYADVEDDENDWVLLPVVTEAGRAPPEGREALVGAAFWYNKRTGERQWARPKVVDAEDEDAGMGTRAFLAAAFDRRAAEMPESEPDDGNIGTLDEFWSESHVKAAHAAMGLSEAELADMRRAMAPDAENGGVLWGEYVLKAGRMVREVYRGKAVSYDEDWCSLTNASKPAEHFWYCKRSCRSVQERPAESDYVAQMEKLREKEEKEEAAATASLDDYLDARFMGAAVAREGCEDGKVTAKSFWGVVKGMDPLVTSAALFKLKENFKLEEDDAGQVEWTPFVEVAEEQLTAAHIEEVPEEDAAADWVELEDQEGDIFWFNRRDAKTQRRRPRGVPYPDED